MSTKNIMLCCVAGMSTSLLVNKMKKAATELEKDVVIFATSVSGFDQELASREVDCVMLGPQVSYMEKDFKEKLKDKNMPLSVINMQDYGMMNGEKVLLQAYELMGGE
ncbi:PTS sugar transporter subunit IIB [Leuconostoc gasicomitatum]|uniref:PTS sugar transporter subunit IIB n=1 Tax=Leuconostoc gasicomitatum TaxID=115778 RepID=A0A9Q3SYL8_9LACO|nr:PTS sugar transporter subunit IIB [Leuconostoc gasicomitatum]MBZ5946900.1 PTS sugar transporter subunit IIB [Leuconostoc gasicomitatum]MBZ5952445.1 PTS sugar transporter subunit IIB [Leuconostoc gasicomitatum]MBZ5955536.1 PTS sugar transporter subunit IIB [Leuconostoc gasicomitatum]MBZ5962439.1 PTS sugar transporter subunit IIB [Leuconostoc gasicomitatum]MBZ5969304.1 PTS sugar transporter subunit IIB [Leuconostoc gasicomitatum]